MAEIDESAEIKPVITEATWGFLFLRLWIGFRMLFAGAEKFYYKVVVDEAMGIEEWKFAWGHAVLTAKENIHKVVADNAFLPLNPKDFLVKVFGIPEEKVAFLGFLQFDLWFAMALPYLLLVFGFLLIIGVLPRVSLFVAGITFMLLSIGLMSLPDNEGIAFLGIHVGLVAVAMCLVKQARFNLTKY
jgi:thiosulfate dehydrogenase [quinone] large subunit